MTSEPKWTAGPWEVGASRNGYARINGARYTPQQHMGMAKVVIEIDDGPYPKGEANARLIAAAPELYEALARLLTWVKPLVSGTDREEIDSIEHACVALRKARGE